MRFTLNIIIRVLGLLLIIFLVYVAQVSTSIGWYSFWFRALIEIKNYSLIHLRCSPLKRSFQNQAKNWDLRHVSKFSVFFHGNNVLLGVNAMYGTWICIIESFPISQSIYLLFVNKDKFSYSGLLNNWNDKFLAFALLQNTTLFLE